MYLYIKKARGGWRLLATSDSNGKGILEGEVLKNRADAMAMRQRILDNGFNEGKTVEFPVGKKLPKNSGPKKKAPKKK